MAAGFFAASDLLTRATADEMTSGCVITIITAAAWTQHKRRGKICSATHEHMLLVQTIVRRLHGPASPAPHCSLPPLLPPPHSVLTVSDTYGYESTSLIRPPAPTPPSSFQYATSVGISGQQRARRLGLLQGMWRGRSGL